MSLLTFPARTEPVLGTADQRHRPELVQANPTATSRAVVAAQTAPAITIGPADAVVRRGAHVRVTSGTAIETSAGTFGDTVSGVVIGGNNTPKLAVHSSATHRFGVLGSTATTSSIPRGATTPRRIPRPTATRIARATRSRPCVTAATSSRGATAAACIARATRGRAAVTPRRTIRSAAIATGVPCATVAARSATRADVGRPLAVAVEVEQATRQPDDQGQQSQRFQIHRHQCPARSQPTSLPRGCKAGVFTDG